MSEVEVRIEEAAIRLGLELERLGNVTAAKVVGQLRERYVRGNPRAWWLDLAVPCTKYDSSNLSLSSVLPSMEGRTFLIPEIDGGTPRL